MYNEESASLVLRTSDLPSNSSNNIGSSNLYYTDMTWSNINLRTLLGSMMTNMINLLLCQWLINQM